MKQFQIQLFFLFGMIISLSSCYYDNEVDLYGFDKNPCDTIAVTYSETIAPIMSANCNNCHNPVSPNGEPPVITSTYEGLKVVAENGKLYNAVFWVDGKHNMPQGSSKLSDCDLSKIDIWLRNGAKNE